MRDPLEGMRLVRFEAFEVNLTTGEVRKHGIRLKVQDQPFQVLVMLLARPGRLVTRDEIREKLWPSGTFVDFDNGLNTCAPVGIELGCASLEGGGLPSSPFRSARRGHNSTKAAFLEAPL